MSFRPNYYARVGPGRRPKFAAFDLETEGLGGRVLAATWITEDETEAHYCCDGDIVQTLFYAMCEAHEYQWFAHNAQYDWRYFVDRLIEYREDLGIFSRGDNDIFMLTLDLSDTHGEKAKLIMRDSLVLFPAKLEKFTKQFVPEASKLHIDFEKEIFDPKNSEHVRYAKRDVEALVTALVRFNDLLLEHFGVNVRMTIASTALAAWQRTLDRDTKFFNDKRTEELVRNAYYGGYVYLSTLNAHENCRTYDINSSYPYQMLTHDYPYGANGATFEFDPDTLGVYDVTISCPHDIPAPIIPARDARGTLVWRTGTFRTHSTTPELNFALEHGYRILRIHRGQVWTETVQPFAEFIGKCRSIREEYRKQALEAVAKLMQNSFSGKLGSKRERRKFYGTLSDENVDGAELWGDFFIRTEYSDDMQCLPLWAAFTTAYARLHILRKIYEIGAHRVLYCDTDSLTVSREVDMVSSVEYGGFKLEKEWDIFRPRAPKVYAGLVGGKIAGAAKGIPKKAWKRQHVLERVLWGSPSGSDRIFYTSLVAFSETLRNPDQLGELITSRLISSLEASSSWQALPDGSVRPKAWAQEETDSFEDQLYEMFLQERAQA